MFDVKTLAVDGAHPQPRQRGAVLRRAIAFVTGEAVAGVFAVQFSHQRIAGGLGQHRGGGDRQRAPVRRAAAGTSQALGQFKHLRKPGTVTVSGNLGKEMPPGTLNSVLKQAQLQAQLKE